MVERYFVDACLVASSLKGCCEELVEAGDGGVLVDESSWEYDDIGIVVLAYEVCNLGSPDESCAHALMLVERHADAFSGAADGDAGIDGTFFDGITKGMTEVGVVTTGFAVGAEIAKDDAAFSQVFLNEFFKREASMVTR